MRTDAVGHLASIMLIMLHRCRGGGLPWCLTHMRLPPLSLPPQVIADHIRAVVFLVADGIAPSNVGRGYVLRRLLRRVVLKGRLLGIPPTPLWTPRVAREAIRLSADFDPLLATASERILAEVSREEERFGVTLLRGEALLGTLLDAAAGGPPPRVLVGRDAFVLYDTFGFPLEITVELAAARGVSVDEAGFAAAMLEQQARSKAAVTSVDLTAAGSLAALVPLLGETAFSGYSSLEGESVVAALLAGGRAVEHVEPGTEVDVVLSTTPFYAESGGQVGDHGVLECSGGARLEVLGAQKAAGGALVLHRVRVGGAPVSTGERVVARVDVALRRRARCHHTATHLLQAALKRVLGSDVAQAGSYVGFDRLRFDFNLNRGVTAAELALIEGHVNTWIMDARPTVTREMALTEAKLLGATAMFGEKYGASVRVVDVPGVSMELCGGTHVENTAEISMLRVLSETGIASGVRRIEAVAGPAALEYSVAMDSVVRTLMSSLRCTPDAVAGRVASLQEELRDAHKEATALKASLAVARSAACMADVQPLPGGSGQLLVARLDGADADALRTAAERLLQTMGDPAVVMLGSQVAADKVSLVAFCSPGAVEAGLNAGKLVSAAAKLCGGGGGGKPQMAQAGGRDVSKLDDALALARNDCLQLKDKGGAA